MDEGRSEGTMNLIVSVDEKWGIGKDSQLLFSLPPDMRFFKQKTIGGAVIMGRKTLETLPNGNPLMDRINIVMSRNPAGIPGSLPVSLVADRINNVDNKDADNKIWVCKNLYELSQYIEGLAIDQSKIWVIGGAGIYQLLTPYCAEAYVTKVLAEDAQADCHMVNLDAEAGWELEERGVTQEWEGLRFHFDRYHNHKEKYLSDE